MKLRFFGASIQWRVIFALLASLLWWAMAEISGSLVNGAYLMWATGGVYSALVLVPYLPGIKGVFMPRAVALVFFGVLSYWSAQMFAADAAAPGIWMLDKQTVSMEIAGALGAVIIGIGARLLVPLALRWRGWFLLVGAGLLGAWVLNLGFEAGAGRLGGITYLYWLPGHVTWQVLVCLALYYGSDRPAIPKM